MSQTQRSQYLESKILTAPSHRLHLLLIATYQLWRSGFAPGGRQLLPLVPLLDKLTPLVSAVNQLR